FTPRLAFIFAYAQSMPVARIKGAVILFARRLNIAEFFKLGDFVAFFLQLKLSFCERSLRGGLFLSSARFYFRKITGICFFTWRCHTRRRSSWRWVRWRKGASALGQLRCPLRLWP